MYRRPVATDIKEAERLVEATFYEEEPERQRANADDLARARFDETLATPRQPSLIARLLRWAGRSR